MRIVKNEGIDSDGSSQRMPRTFPAIKMPTISSGGLVAKGEIPGKHHRQEIQ
ncbi:MAG TPA: hypothetical protein V6C95_21580 [Coleofasciculaceae cyanobacterium]